jgi:hypothetical protein
VDVRHPPAQTRRWRRFGLVAGGALALAAGLFAFWLGTPGSKLRPQNLAAVRPGMTRQQVADLLGGPPGDFGSFPDGPVDSGDGSVRQLFAEPTARPVTAENWVDDRASITVFFDDEGRVVAASQAAVFRRRPRGGLLELVLRRVGAARPPSVPPPKG